MFVTAHQSVEATSLRMYQTLKRRNYVTPTNYLETVANYRALLSEKRSELSSKANKLKGGLTKLDETRVQVCPTMLTAAQLVGETEWYPGGSAQTCE
jgi:dynein heavy chain